MQTGFDSVGITAKMAAYMRQFSDIPFATEVAEWLGADEALERLRSEHDLKLEDLTSLYAPIFEIRYKSLAAAIVDSGIPQVLELASGVSLRGLNLAMQSGIRYVESDLPGINREKTQLIASIARQRGFQVPANYRIADANALDLDQIRAAVSHFDRGQPIALVHEGLFPYLDAAEMETVARNIRNVLEAFGGRWITPDLQIREPQGAVSEAQLRVRKATTETTDRPMYQSSFEDEEALRRFAEDLGFEIDGRQLEMAGQSSRRFKLWILDLSQRMG